MFSHHVSAVMFCRLWCSLSKGFGVSFAFLFSLTCGLLQAEGYGFHSDARYHIQQAPLPQTEPGAKIFLPIIVGEASSDHDERPSQPSISVTGAADQTDAPDGRPPPNKKRYTFVTDAGGHLDGYWFRNDLPDEQLKFTIEITSPTVSRLNLDPQGFLTQDAVDDLARRGVMPHEAELTLQVFDVDHDPNAETVYN